MTDAIQAMRKAWTEFQTATAFARRLRDRKIDELASSGVNRTQFSARRRQIWDEFHRTTRREQRCLRHALCNFRLNNPPPWHPSEKLYDYNWPKKTKS